jgi:hypothetical protein
MASKSLGTLTLDLIAKIGGFVGGLNKADRETQKFAKDQERRFKEMNVAAIALGNTIGNFLTDGIIRAANAFPALVDAIDQFNDVKDATGASIENISALDRVARETGTTMESVEGILVKFNAALKEAKPDNEAGAVFKQLNLNIAELKALDPAEALRQTAVAFSKFADDGNKARAMQELFGKSIREASPFLNDLAEKTELVGTTSAEAARQAEVFNKQIFALKADIGDLARAITSDLVPALSRAIKNFSEFKAQGNLGLIFKDAAKDVLGFGKLTDDAGKDINRFMKERERLRKNLSFAEDKGRPTSAIQDEINEINRYLQVARTRQKTLVDQTSAQDDYTDAVSRRFNAEKKSLSVPDPTKKPTGGGSGGGAKTDPFAEAQRYIESLQKQLERTQELTVAEQALQDIQMGRLGQVTDAQKEQILATAAQIDALKEQKKAEEDMKKYKEAVDKVNVSLLEMQGHTAEAAAIKFDQENSALYTLFSDKGDAAMVKKLDTLKKLTVATAQLKEEQDKYASTTENLRIQEERIALNQQMGIYGELDGLKRLGEARTAAYEQQREQYEKIRAIADASGDSKLIQEAERLKLELDQLGASLDPLADKFNTMFADRATDAFTSIVDGSKTAKEALGDLVDGLISDFIRLAAQDVFKSFFSGGGSATGGTGFDFGSILSSLFAGNRALGGPVMPNSMYRINERGPEIYKAANGSQYLMTGTGSGSVVPNAGGVTINQTFAQGTSRETTQQAALQASRELRRAQRNA